MLILLYQDDTNDPVTDGEPCELFVAFGYDTEDQARNDEEFLSAEKALLNDGWFYVGGGAAPLVRMERYDETPFDYDPDKMFPFASKRRLTD